MRGVEKSRKGKIILVIIIVVLLVAAGIGTYFALKNGTEQDADATAEELGSGLMPADLQQIITSDTNNFDEKYEEGLISADEYLWCRLEMDNQALTQMHVSDFVDEHLDELSDEALEYYYRKMCLDNIMPIGSAATPAESSQAESSIPDLFGPLKVYAATYEEQAKKIKIIASPNKKFMVWYCTEGEFACTEENARRAADTLEETVKKYDDIFGATYQFTAEVFSKGEAYDAYLGIVKSNGFTEDDFQNSMQVYIAENKEAYATWYGPHSDLVNRMLDKLNSGDKNGVLILPYILINAKDLDDNLEKVAQLSNHELFHHYQHLILTDEYSAITSADEFAKEATANWACSLVTTKTTNKGFLNNWAAVARKNPNYVTDTGQIEKFGKEHISYAMFPYLYEYSQRVPNGVDRIKDAMYKEDFFGNLWQEIMLEDLNDLQESYMMHLLIQDYDNMNLVFNPEEAEDINYRKTFDIENSSTKTMEDIDVKLSVIGVELYKIIPDGKHKFQIDFLRECETVVGYLVGEKDGEFTWLGGFDRGYDLNYTFNSGGVEYDTYYFAVGNSSMSSEYSYAVKITTEEIEEEPEIDLEELVANRAVTRDDLPETGHLTFRSYFVYDDEKENVYITYYYAGNTITRIVYTTIFTEDAREEWIDACENDVINNPGMYKETYIRNERKLVCEYTEKMVEMEVKTVDDLIKMINGVSLLLEGEFVIDFEPAL